MELELALAITLVLAVGSWTQEVFPKEAQTLNWNKVRPRPSVPPFRARAEDYQDYLQLRDQLRECPLQEGRTGQLLRPAVLATHSLPPWP